MKKYIKMAVLLFALSLCSAPLWAQMEGSVRGNVTDQNNKPLPGATVQLYDAQTGRKYEVKTNSKGEYASIGIAAGTYKMTLIQNGNPIDEHNNVPIAAGQERVVNFELAKDIGGGATEEQRQKVAAAQKHNEVIKGLNATLGQVKQLEAAGNYDQAVTMLQQATQTAPDQDLLWGYLGDAQRGQASKATDSAARTKGYQDAVASYQKALALKPNNAPYLAGMADAYAKSGQTDKAVESYAAAAQADPTNAANYYYNEGAVLTNVNKSDEAIAAFDKAIQLDPTRADAYYWKGIDLVGKATMGKDNKMVAPPGTAEAFQKYLELQPTGKYADASKQMLATIGSSVETSYGKKKK